MIMKDYDTFPITLSVSLDKLHYQIYSLETYQKHTKTRKKFKTIMIFLLPYSLNSKNLLLLFTRFLLDNILHLSDTRKHLPPVNFFCLSGNIYKSEKY